LACNTDREENQDDEYFIGNDVLPGSSFETSALPMPCSSSKKQRGRKEIMTVKISSALDKCKVSDRDAVHLIIAVSESLGHNVSDIIVNRSSIKRYREKTRLALATEIRNAFSVSQLNALVLHWDGKLLPDLCGKQTVDRLPIVITNGDNEQLLGVPKLLHGTSKAQAEAIYQLLVEWGLKDHVKAMCFDTTATNTGKNIILTFCVILFN